LRNGGTPDGRKPARSSIGFAAISGVTETIDYRAAGGTSRLGVRIAKKLAIGKS
jgi:hypothetical protein